MNDDGIVYEPSQPHRCAPPRFRPKDEWRSRPAPPGWTKPKDRARGVKLTMPTPYPVDTVWVCRCGRGWIRRAGQHYGRNPNFGHTEGSWSPLPWYAFRIRRRIDAHQRERAYENDRAIVDSFVLPDLWRPGLRRGGRVDDPLRYRPIMNRSNMTAQANRPVSPVAILLELHGMRELPDAKEVAPQVSRGKFHSACRCDQEELRREEQCWK